MRKARWRGGGREPATQRQAGACNRFTPGERARCCALFNSTRYCTVTHHRFPSDVAPHMILRRTNLSSSRAKRFLPDLRELPNTRRTVETFVANNARRIASHEGRLACLIALTVRISSLMHKRDHGDPFSFH